MIYKCEVCRKVFEPKRKDQVLCSKACKQKRYRETKSSSDKSREEKESGYSYSEWIAFLEYIRRDNVEMPFIVFCFLRNNISSAIKEEKLFEVLSNILYDMGDIDGVKMTQAYREFKDKIFSRDKKILL